MFGQTVSGRADFSSANSRCFRFEVRGLRQNAETDKMNCSIRSSGSVFTTVPFARMSEEMQRITRSGGTIVSIKPLVK
jgi:CpcD/allophycocyanin linker domain